VKKVDIKMILGVFFAIILAAIGVCIFVESGLGSDTLTVLIEGIHTTFGVTLGSGSMICNLILLSVALLLARENVGSTTVIYTLMIGFAIDFMNRFIVLLHISEAIFGMKIFYVGVAQICFGLCYALLIKYRKGMHCIDAIIYYFMNKYNVPYIIGRTSMDIIFVIAGILLGGVVGVGTIISCATTGILVDFFVKIIKVNSKEDFNAFTKSSCKK